MAQTGFTPIQLYFSSTTTNVPLAANLASGELAINITDGKLFYKDNANAVQVIGWKVVPTTAGGTGLTSYTAGDLPYYATGTTLSKLGIGASTTVITSSGSAPQWTAQSALSVGTAANLLSNATTGVMQITGPGTGTTRVMTIPDANFTAARTDAAQTFTGLQTFNGGTQIPSGQSALFGTTGFTASIYYNGNGNLSLSPRSGYDTQLDSGNLVVGTSGKGITTGSAIPLGFGTNNGTALATLLNSGGLSLGSTVDPGAANLYVGTSGNSGNYGRITAKAATADANSNVIYLENSAPARLFQVRSDGYFVTGAAANSPYNNTTGSAANVFVDSSGVLYRSTSSLKYKINVQDSTHGLNEVLQLRPVTYQTKNESDKQKIFGGFIAEEIDQLGLSEFVNYRNDDGTPDAIDYGNMVSLLTKAIQELNKKFDDYVASHP
jgi:hypothetical protein